MWHSVHVNNDIYICTRTSVRDILVVTQSWSHPSHHDLWLVSCRSTIPLIDGHWHGTWTYHSTQLMCLTLHHHILSLNVNRYFFLFILYRIWRVGKAWVYVKSYFICFDSQFQLKGNCVYDCLNFDTKTIYWHGIV